MVSRRHMLKGAIAATVVSAIPRASPQSAECGSVVLYPDIDNWAILQSVANQGGGVVYLESGTYPVSQSVMLSNSIALQFRGIGRILMPTGVPLFELGNTTTVEIYGLRTTRRSQYAAIRMPRGTTVDRLVVADCDLQHNIVLLGTVTKKLLLADNFLGGATKDPSISINAEGLTTSVDIVRNRLEASPERTSDAVIVGGLIDYILIEGNHVEGYENNDAFDLDTCRYARVVNNVVKNCRNGYDVKAGSRPDGDGLRDIVFQGNIADDCLFGAYWRDGPSIIGNTFVNCRYGLWIDNRVPVSILGNDFHGSTSHHIKGNALYDVSFIGNRFGLVAADPVRIDKGRRVLFSGNHFEEWPTNRAAVRLFDDITDVWFRDNTFVNGGGWVVSVETYHTNIKDKGNWLEGLDGFYIGPGAP